MTASGEVFTADPANLDFPVNRVERIAAIRKATVRLAVIELALAVGFPAADAIISIVRFGTVGDGFPITILFFLSLSILGELALYVIWRQNSRLYAEGDVLPGSIAACSGKMRNQHYEVTVRYRFLTPESEERTGKFTLTREDLKNQPLPAIGTPVRVLYRTRRDHRLL